MIKLQNEKQSIRVELEAGHSHNPVFYFCENGYQSTGVSLSKEQFEMLRSLITNTEIVEHYESMPNKKK